MNKAAFLLALLLLATTAHAEDERIDALTTFMTTGEKTPVGGIGVYSKDYGKRIGTIETLGDGSTVLRGDYGRVIARVPPSRSAAEPLRIEMRER